MLFGVEALNRHLLVCDRGFCAMFSQSAQEQTVEVIQLVPKKQILEHIVEEIVVLVPQVMEEKTDTCAESHSRTDQGCSYASDSRGKCRGDQADPTRMNFRAQY